MDKNTIEIIKLVFQFISIIGVPTIIGMIFSKKILKQEKNKETQNITIENEKKQNQCLLIGMKILLRNCIYDICNKVKKREYFYLYELEQLDETFKVYEDLGGNGTAHRIYEEVKVKYEVKTDMTDTTDNIK